jgi:hypothetical protein
MLAAQAGAPLLAAAGLRHWIVGDGHPWSGGARPPVRSALVRFWVKQRVLRLPLPLTGARTVLPLARDGGCGLVSTSPGEYRRRAEDCERLAASATNAEVRKTLLYRAKRWRGFERQTKSVRPRSGNGAPQHPSK